MAFRYVVPGALSAIAVLTLFAMAPKADQTPVTSVEIIVPATSGWVGTGIGLSPGESVNITASASWTPVPQQRVVGPMGFAEACGADCSFRPIHANQGPLIGRVGASGVPFVVGEQVTCAGGPAHFSLKVRPRFAVPNDWKQVRHPPGGVRSALGEGLAHLVRTRGARP